MKPELGMKKKKKFPLKKMTSGSKNAAVWNITGGRGGQGGLDLINFNF